MGIYGENVLTSRSSYKSLPQQNLALLLLRLEPFIVALVGIVLWYSERLGAFSFVMLIPVLWARWQAHGRLWTRTPLDVMLFALPFVGIANLVFAPYPPHIFSLARPLYGIFLCLSLVEYARASGSMMGVLRVALYVALVFSILAPFTTRWELNKSWQLRGVINAIPQVTGGNLIPSFNPNEIALVLAWLMPVVAVLAFYHAMDKTHRRLALMAFVVSAVAVFLGQSRIVIVSLLVAFMVLSFLAIPRGRWRYLAIACIVLVGVLELAVTTRVATPNSSESAIVEQQQARDEKSVVGRYYIWQKALRIIADYPLTGVGLANFDDEAVRERYPMGYWGTREVHHAHNEFLQIMVDLGIPGLMIFLGLYVISAYMLFYVWRNGDSGARIVTTAVACGLLAHALSSVADATKIWNPSAFVFWLMLGIAGAQYVLVRQQKITRGIN